jgi:CRISPR-associated protein Cas2
MYLVVSYDIESDKRRSRIHRTLKNFGQWVQYSVFECDLTRAQYLVLRHRLDNHLKKTDGDNMRFYFLCEDCQTKVERIGGETPRHDGTIIV